VIDSAYSVEEEFHHCSKLGEAENRAVADIKKKLASIIRGKKKKKISVYDTLETLHLY